MNDGDEVVSLPRERERAKRESLLKFISPFTMCIIGETTIFNFVFVFCAKFPACNKISEEILRLASTLCFPWV